MASLPPICLRGYFITSAINVDGNPNLYTITINQIESQRYSSSTNTSLFYTGNDVQVGMYASSDINGKIFRIIRISNKSSISITGTFEDIEGLNKRFDSSGSGAGNPSDNFGYIFQVNSDGLPLLTRVDNALSQTFTDSIVARFLYEKKPTMTENFCVLTGAGTNTLAVTYDGKTIIGLGNSIFSVVGNSVAYNGKIWVAVGSGGTAIATSTDGLNWVARASPLSVGNSVAWNGKLWVVVGSGTATVVTSVDGTNWVSRGKPIATDGYAIIWDGTKFLAGGTGTSSTNKLIESYDGITWTGIPFTSLSEIYALASNGYIWLAGGRQGTVSIFTTTMCFSQNGGYSWSNVSSAYPGGESGVVLSKGTRNFAWNGSLWIAVGDGISRVQEEIDGFIQFVDTPRAIATSIDGITWTGQLNNYFPNSGAYGVEWNGSQWFVGGFGASTSLITSTNGTTWSDQKNLIFSIGKNLSSRKIPFVQQPLTQVRSIQVFARGTGKNASDPNNGGEPYARRVVLNGTQVSETSGDTTQRGLYLTIINGTNFSVLSTTQYNTAGTNSNPSINLANALNGMTRQQIGILTSYREWETKISSSTLTTAALRLGLTKLATFSNTTNSGRPYCAIFYGGGTDTTNVGTHDVIERMESNDGDAPLAIVSATLTTDGTFPSIIGASSTNALYTANSNTANPTVYVDSTEFTNIWGGGVISRAPIRVNMSDTVGSGQVHYHLNNADGFNRFIIGIQTPELGSDSGSNFQIYRYNDAGIWQENALTIRRSNGFTGIGNSDPKTKLDVNGHIRGKGSIVNTVLLSSNPTMSWLAYSRNFLACQTTYTPIQSSSVNIVMHASAELIFNGGSGFDALYWQVNLYNPITIIRAFRDSFQDFLVFSQADYAKLSINTDIFCTEPGSTYPQNILRSISPFRLAQLYTSYTLQGTSTVVQYVGRINSNQNFVSYSSSSIVSLAAQIYVKTVQQYSQNFDTNNVTGRVTGSPNSFGVGTSITTISEPVIISLFLTAGSDDTTYYRNAYLTIHEISST